ncbi:replication protein RepA [Falsiroseomonas sp. HW251]|uniref:replication protein RepA n=1 Tax=Falsiroseomonas sp. HW251 TaxID=3390998 RepID=UPI003D317AA9
MSLDRPPRARTPDTAVTQPADAFIWLHAAFCSMALPMQATRGAWQRDIDAGSVRVEPSASDDMVPSGPIFRLSMMHICDAAFRSNSLVVELGTDKTLLAAALGIDPKTSDLADQWQRLQAARILLSDGGSAEVSVFDARSRRRVGDLGWRSAVRLSTKFLSSLVDHAVPLDRRVVRELSASPAALDAYAWIRMSLRHAPADQIVTTTWNDLLKRFGTASQDVAGFRLTFNAALRLVFEADDSVDLAVDDEGVSVRRAKPAENESAAEATTPMQPRTDTIEVDGEKQNERLAFLPATAPVAPAPEGAKPPVLRRQHLASQKMPRGDQGVASTAADDRIMRDSISLTGHLTGLAQVIWLRRGHGEENVLVGVTPTPRFEAERLTVLAVEPMVIQVSGGLNEKDFERVSAWVMSNRDVIDEFWEGRITSFSELNRRVRKAPAPGWR